MQNGTLRFPRNVDITAQHDHVESRVGMWSRALPCGAVCLFVEPYVCLWNRMSVCGAVCLFVKLHRRTFELGTTDAEP
jgi:hypothetical protein